MRTNSNLSCLQFVSQSAVRFVVAVLCGWLAGSATVHAAVAVIKSEDNFEARAVGSSLGNAAWSAVVSGPFISNAYVTNNITAPGSTKSAVFLDTSGTDQLWSLFRTNAPAAGTAGFLEFDVYVDNRGGPANFGLRHSVGLSSSREVELLLQSPSFGSPNWELILDESTGATTFTNVPAQAWHRIGFFNDVANNLYRVYFDGVMLTNGSYAVGLNTLTTMDAVQFRSLGTDEDIYIDNVLLFDNDPYFVPEPSGLLLFSLGAFILWRRKAATE